MAHDLVTELLQYSSLACFMPIWQLCANLLIPNCLRSNLSYSPLAALELYVKCYETIIEQGKLVCKGDNIMLVDGENSGEVFTVPQDGYMGSTFKQLWISSSMYEPYVLAFIQFYKETLRNSKKGAAIPHLNKELFYGLIIGIPSLQEQRRIVQKIEQLMQLLK
ncbi:restriction endonuclease subunit S [Leyella stercorea]|uniref:restriction endonuclease subunit S n=1 Tax=Leyella stercorea TaxID=363265 RepID=UPI003521C4E3